MLLRFLVEQETELNELSNLDIEFFTILLIVIAVCVLAYFLIPLLNRKQYKEQRENLRKREEAFKANKKSDK